MRNSTIAICEQTHAECQGFAHDDHIDKTCHTVYYENTEIEKRTRDLIKRINEKSDENLRVRSLEWAKNNPDDEECIGEGEEFIGHTWIEASAPQGDPNTEHSNYSIEYDLTGTQVIELLNSMLD